MAPLVEYRGTRGQSDPCDRTLAGADSFRRTNPRAMASDSPESTRPDARLLAGYRVVRRRFYPRCELGSALPGAVDLDKGPIVRGVRAGPNWTGPDRYRMDRGDSRLGFTLLREPCRAAQSGFPEAGLLRILPAERV